MVWREDGGEVEGCCEPFVVGRDFEETSCCCCCCCCCCNIAVAVVGFFTPPNPLISVGCSASLAVLGVD